MPTITAARVKKTRTITRVQTRTIVDCSSAFSSKLPSSGRRGEHCGQYSTSRRAANLEGESEKVKRRKGEQRRCLQYTTVGWRLPFSPFRLFTFSPSPSLFGIIGSGSPILVTQRISGNLNG